MPQLFFNARDHRKLDLTFKRSQYLRAKTRESNSWRSGDVALREGIKECLTGLNSRVASIVYDDPEVAERFKMVIAGIGADEGEEGSIGDLRRRMCKLRTLPQK